MSTDEREDGIAAESFDELARRTATEFRRTPTAADLRAIEQRAAEVQRRRTAGGVVAVVGVVALAGWWLARTGESEPIEPSETTVPATEVIGDPSVTYATEQGGLYTMLGIVDDGAAVLAATERDSNGTTITRWSAATGAVESTLVLPAGWTAGTVVPSTDHIVAVDEDGQYHVVDGSGEEVGTVPGTGRLLSLDGRYLATDDAVWDLVTVESRWDWAPDDMFAVSADGSTVAIFRPDTIEVRSTDTFERVDVAQQSLDALGPASSAALSADGRLLAVTKRFGMARLVDLTTGETSTIPGNGYPYAVAFSKDGRYLATRSDESVTVVRTDDRQVVVKRTNSTTGQPAFAALIRFNDDSTFVVVSNGAEPERYDLP